MQNVFMLSIKSHSIMDIRQLVGELSAIDLKHLLNELTLQGSKIEQIYQDGNRLIFHLYKEGKKRFFVILPSHVYCSEEKGSIPVHPPQFGLALRRYLKGAWIDVVEQPGLERIIILTCKKKDTLHLVIELFGTGNVILCNADMKIITPMHQQRWKDRTIRGGQIYTKPTREIDISQASSDEIQSLLTASDAENIVVFLARSGLGGKYAESVCELAGIEKESPVHAASGEKIHSAIKTLLSQKLKLNEKLDKELSSTIQAAKEQQQEAKQEAAGTKIERIITAQKHATEGLKKTIEKNTRKGELIYEHYQDIAKLLDAIHKLRKTHRWDELKKLIGEKCSFVKNISEQDGKVYLDL